MPLQYLVNAKAPLLTWDIFSTRYNALMAHAVKHQQSILAIKKIAKANKWDKLQTQEALENFNKYVILITDNQQQISFACSGFEQMTGYTFDEVKGKNPNFLQGAKTNRTQTHLIKDKIAHNESSETILENYRKDGELYLCKIIIKPIVSIQQKLVNYIAYEQEIAA